jgi:2-keto-3-deoxy-L-rhamnonate aldolase RhmA
MDMKSGNEFRVALRSGKTVYGTLITSPSPRMFDAVVSLGCDFVFLCSEHIFYNHETLGWMCRAYSSAGITPVVRILKPDPFLATQALDSGAGAILAPYVEDIEQVAELIGAVKYRPLKGKKLKDILSGKERPGEELESYIKHHNRNNTLLLNIESPAGVANMDAFFGFDTPSGPGVDGIVIGPHDLSVSYEMPEQYSSEKFSELSCGIIRKARAMGRAAGGHNGSRGSLELQKKWAAAGATIIMHSSDVFLFADKFNDDINILRSIKGDKSIDKSQTESV